MIFTFFQNMTLIIAFTFIYIKLKNNIVEKTKDKKWWVIAGCSIYSFLSMATMFNPLQYDVFIFDLRSVPIFFVSYKFGWKAGLLASILPSLYRWNIGGAGVIRGVLITILLPALAGAVLSSHKRQSGPLAPIDIRGMFKDFVIFNLIKEGLIWITLDIPFKDWALISVHVTVFSALALLSIMIMIDDANKNERAERTLRISEERYKKLVELLPDAILVHEEDTVVYANRAAMELMGLSSQSDIADCRLENLIKPPRDYADICEVVRDFQEGRISSSLVESKLLLRDGAEIDVEIRGVSFKSEGEFLIINVIRDITSNKKAQELEEKIKHERKLLQEAIEYDKMKTDFFANLSHEMKTPINLIFSAVQLMEFDINNSMKEKNHSLSNRIRVLKQNCYRMLKLANNLIDITKIDAGYLSLDIQNCNIISIVEDVTLSVAEYIENSNIKLLFDTDVEEKIIAVDPNAVERIMLNLLSNAVKFTRPGNEILVDIHDKGESVLITVKDRGLGIPADKLDIIFDRFRQADESLNRKHEGSGIGLSLVKSLIDIHGGTITVKSKVGEGSEFIIQLPSKVLEDGSEQCDKQDMWNNYIETIRVEFSDIYSLN